MLNTSSNRWNKASLHLWRSEEQVTKLAQWNCYHKHSCQMRWLPQESNNKWHQLINRKWTVRSIICCAFQHSYQPMDNDDPFQTHNRCIWSNDETWQAWCHYISCITLRIEIWELRDLNFDIWQDFKYLQRHPVNIDLLKRLTFYRVILLLNLLDEVYLLSEIILTYSRTNSHYMIEA